MSKRRKRNRTAYAEKSSEKEEMKRTSTEGKPTETVKKTKTGGRTISLRNTFLYSIVIAVVFFGIGYLANPLITGQITSQHSTSDQLIFISPPGCTNCSELETVTKDVANTLGIPFVKTGYSQQMKNPGYVLIYNDSFLGAVGFDSEATIKNQICQLTKNEKICEEANGAQQPQPSAPEVPKSDRPEAHAFIMSHCPYGLQFLKAYVPVMELLGDKADLQINFVPYIMHGEDEMKDNNRIYCIQREQKDKLTDYLRCYLANNANYDKCVEEVGIDQKLVDSCISEIDTKFEITKNFKESGERFPPYLVDAELAQVYGARGSPTFGINGQQVRVNRAPEAIKQAICSAFNSPPAECSQTLSSTPESPGFGPVGSGGGSSGGGAQCG